MARIDYDVGDEIVCVRLPDGVDANPILVVNKIYTCVAFSNGDPKAAAYKYCPMCGTQAKYDLVVYLQDYPYSTCPCWFRKKLDFRKLCEVDETIKIKDDA